MSELCPTCGAVQPARNLPPWLTPDRLAVLRLVAQGATNHRIAEFLDISLHAVQGHIKAMRYNARTFNSTELALWAIREGIVPLHPAAASRQAEQAG